MSHNYHWLFKACMMKMQVEAWHPCPHIPGCITVNIGDALQRFSDGLLKSNFHRVRMPADGESQARAISMPCGCNQETLHLFAALLFCS